ncbi:helix-turn-helix domain-containing protein [Desemzia sp. FAM 23991]|uniref:helix-turn-helix domain-containing protein n=1 Tax=unclassified Desemzia TaxID=2685243 RepID=UPI0038865571
MYLSILETAEYLQLPVNEIHRLIREKQVRVVRIDNETLLNKEQFDLFLKAREKKKAEIEEYLNTPLPEDPDIKDED